MQIARFLVALVALALAPACVISSGRLEANRFQHEVYPYALFYPPSGKPESPLGPHYRVVNFRSPDGQHRYQRAGEGFTVERSYESESPALVQRELFYDLLLARDTPEAAFWIRSVPLRPEDAQLSLAELAQRYLDAVAKFAAVAAPLGVEQAEPPETQATVHEASVRSCELSKRPAVRVDFRVQNPAALKTLNEPEWKAGSVVLVQSGYFARRNYPVLVLAGRSSKPGDADALEHDFDQMLERLVLGDKGQGLSMKGGHSCGLDDSQAEPAAVSAGGEAPQGTADQLEVPVIQEGEPAQPEGDAPGPLMPDVAP